jgi:hypothetical protein
MATINSCTNCGCNKAKCGCQDTMLTSPAPCPTPIGCPSPEPCSEVFDAQCVIYTGENIICGTDIVVPANTNVATALQLIVDYYCINVVAYSDVLIFDSVLDSMRYYCNGVQIDVKYGTAQSNITAYVAMLNSNTNFNTYGEYFDNGDGRVRLELPYSVAKTFCPGGVISMVAFYD